MDAIELITLQEALKLIKRNDTRSIKAFCKRNGIQIFSENKGTQRYIIKSELISVRDAILKTKENISLREYLNALSKKYTDLVMKDNKVVETTNYTPVGKHEKETHCELLALIRNVKCPKKNHCSKSRKGSNTSASIATAAKPSQGTCVEKHSCRSNRVRMVKKCAIKLSNTKGK